MGNQTLAEKFREWVMHIGWVLYLWGANLNTEEYHEQYVRELDRIRGVKAEEGGEDKGG